METDTRQEESDSLERGEFEGEQAIDEALRQMTSLYISRCVQPPLGTNVTVREVDSKE